MDLESKGDGRVHFSLGPLEKWVAGVSGLVMVSLAWWLVSSVQTLLTQQAVTNQTLSVIGAQLTDVPQLRSQNAELKIRVDRLEQDMREMRSIRGAK